KLLLKEDLIPRKADTLLFWLAPMLAFAGAFGIYVVIPWGPGMVPANLDVGLVYVVAISSLSTVGIIMAGWASNNKYALYGGFRSAAQAVSFEIPLMVSVVPIVMYSGSLNLTEITSIQAGGIQNWTVLRFFPFFFIGFFAFFISALAEVNRTPFDMPEGDQEIVGGFHVEYSGIRFGMFFLGEYAAMLAVGLIASVAFLGGWHSAWPKALSGFNPIKIIGHSIATSSAMKPAMGTSLATGVIALGIIIVWLGTNAIYEWNISQYHQSEYLRYFNVFMGFSIFLIPVVFGNGPVNLFVKAFFFVFVMFWLRWTLPRVRPDQLMFTCWKVLVPLGFINLAGIGLWMACGPLVAFLSLVVFILILGVLSMFPPTTEASTSS
ncbi:MAG: NADH-quinone oxidoreductase subunit H, partial [bacterium]